MRELTLVADSKCPPPFAGFGFEKVDAFIGSHAVFSARPHHEPVVAFRPVID